MHQPFTALDAAIVDLDGTMIDTMGDFAVALNRMLGELGLPAIEARAIEPMVGRGSEHLIRAVLEHVRAPAALYEAGLAVLSRGTTWPSMATIRRCIPV